MLWLVSRHSLQRFLGAIPRHSWLGFAAGGGGCSSPVLAEGPACGSSPLLAGVRWRRWCVVACHSWLRVLVAVPRHSWLGGPLVAVLGGPLPLLAEGLGCGVPPLLGSADRGGGCFHGWGFPVLCVLVVQRVRVVSVLVCVVCVCGVCVSGGAGVGVPSACVRVCVCVCVCVSCVGGVCLPVPATSSCCWCWFRCGWCVLLLVPRHSWRRFLCDTRRPSQRWQANPPGTAPRHPSQHAAPTGHAGQRGSDGPPHPHARAHSMWMKDPNSPPSGWAVFGGGAPVLRRPSHGGRHPSRGRPSATPTASHAGPQGRTLWNPCWVPTPAPTAPGTHGSRYPGCPPQRTGRLGRDSA